jgi:nucleoside-diphosphate-sugar epimerase
LTEANSLTRIMIQFVRGKWRYLPGDGHHVGNYVFVDDVVRGHQLAIEHGQPGRRYLLGGEDLSFRELFELLRPYARRQQRLIHVPERAVMLFAHGCVGLASCLPVDPRLTPEFARRYFADSRVSSERARRELGYNPGSVRDGIRKTMEWIVRNGISLESQPSRRKRHAAD